MGKVLDDRVVEYAYVNRIVLYPNKEKISNVDGNKAQEYCLSVVINYELKDANKSQLEYKSIEHESEYQKDKLTVSEMYTLIKNNLTSFVSSDKLELANYSE